MATQQPHDQPDRLIAAIHRRHPWRFAAILFCVGYTGAGLCFDVLDQVWPRPERDRAVQYIMPLIFAVMSLVRHDCPFGAAHSAGS